MEITTKRKPEVFYLIRNAVKTLGSYNPNKILSYFEEELTLDEYPEVENFLNWVYVNNETFGRNISEIYTNYREWVLKIDHFWCQDDLCNNCIKTEEN
jgi:hypothetical protein